MRFGGRLALTFKQSVRRLRHEWRYAVGVIVILVLAIAAIVLVRELGSASKLQDCLMSGRTNCAPIDVPPRQ